MPLWTRLVAVFAALALGLAAAGCGGEDDDSATADVPADAIAVVGDREIPKSEYDRLLSQAQATYEAREQEFPEAGTPEFAQLRNALVSSLVEQAQFEIAAEELDVTVSDEELDKRLDELKQQFFDGDEEEYQAELEKQGLTEEQVLKDLRTRMLSEKIFEKVTSEVEGLRRGHPGVLREEQGAVRAAGLARGPAHPREDEGEGRPDPSRSSRTAANFAKLAKQYSQDPSSKSRAASSPRRRARPWPRSTRWRSTSRRASSPSR